MADLADRVAKLEQQVAKIMLNFPAEDEDDTMTPAGRISITDFEAILANEVARFAAACNVYDDLKAIGAGVIPAFANQLELVKAAAVSKKANNEAILKFLGPTAEFIGVATKSNFKSPQYTHQQALENSIGIMSWPLVSPPLEHMNGMNESSGFYLNRILTKAKELDADSKAKEQEFVASYKALLAKFIEIVKKNFKAGLEFNNIKGGDFTAYKAGSVASTASSAPKPAVAAPVTASTPAPSTAPASGGMSSVLGQLNQGLNVTSGLKTVTSDMKAKNQKDLPVVVPSTSAPKVSAPKATAPVIKKDPVLNYVNSSWYIEHHDGNNAIEVKDLTMRDGVYVGNTRNSRINIVGKPKSVVIDKCFKTTVYVSDVLSTIEFVNCDRCNVFITGTCATIAIDKSKGIIVNLSETARSVNPSILTSNISECNVQVPGPTEEDDLIEIPLPEQYENKILANNRVESVAVSHG